MEESLQAVRKREWSFKLLWLLLNSNPAALACQPAQNALQPYKYEYLYRKQNMTGREYKEGEGWKKGDSKRNM
jgi:hypothetical protein